MDFSKNFICRSHKYSTMTEYVNAPALRKKFFLDRDADLANRAEILVCGLGFYRLIINGKEITKGLMAPYRSNPDHIIYYDSYDISRYICKGDNVICLILGNGEQNCPGGYVWEFEKAVYRGAPSCALSLEVEWENGEIFSLTTDTSFKTAPSPIFFDDIRCGEYYDARQEIKGWTEIDFDDSAWDNAIVAPMPRGEARLCCADPIKVAKEILPVEIVKEEAGYRYDFGVNAAGVCKLNITGHPGQQIDLLFGETVIDGKFYNQNIKFDQNDYVQKDIYICKGGEKEEFVPYFTYHGFRYVLVRGLEESQATPELLTYLVCNSAVEERGGFSCSDPMANKLQEITRVSDLANFYYFPTDCPQREKNGWTADAALSAEHMLLNLKVENSYKEWMRNICKSQTLEGAIPGIIPTSGWGFRWGNGPAWDAVLTTLPYYTYLYTGDKEILEVSAPSIMRYLSYVYTRRDQRGLVRYGLGDWCPVGRVSDQYKVPLEVTDSIMVKDIADKAAYIFEALGMDEQKHFAENISANMRKAIRKYLIDFETMTVLGNCQSGQAMGLYYDIFEPGERQAAFARLLEFIEEYDDHMDVGVLGARVIFHVLTSFGYSDLAYKMITREDYPSYGNWVARGATSLWEMVLPPTDPIASLNHHFWGDISGWFIKSIAGIRYNPYGKDFNEIDICPSFIKSIDNAQGWFESGKGIIKSAWTRKEGKILLEISVPEGSWGYIKLENGYTFTNGLSYTGLISGTWEIVEK